MIELECPLCETTLMTAIDEEALRCTNCVVAVEIEPPERIALALAA